MLKRIKQEANLSRSNRSYDCNQLARFQTQIYICKSVFIFILVPPASHLLKCNSFTLAILISCDGSSTALVISLFHQQEVLNPVDRDSCLPQLADGEWEEKCHGESDRVEHGEREECLFGCKNLTRKLIEQIKLRWVSYLSGESKH